MLNQKQFQFRVLLGIPLIIFIVGMIVPLFIGAYYSLTDWNGVSRTYEFIGLSNYIKIFSDHRFYNSAKVTLVFVIFNAVINNVGALFFALILDAEIRAKKVYRIIIFAPVLLSPILAGHIWRQMYSIVLPGFNDILGTNISFNLFSHPDTVVAGLLIANNWQWIGYWMLIYLAGLQTIPKELYEAGLVDGCSWFQKFFNITLPMLAPAITTCTLGITIGSLKVFEIILSSTGGGPARSSEAVVLYIYKTGFDASRASYASSISILYMGFLVILAYILLKILRKREEEMS